MWQSLMRVSWKLDTCIMRLFYRQVAARRRITRLSSRRVMKIQMKISTMRTSNYKRYLLNSSRYRHVDLNDI